MTKRKPVDTLRWAVLLKDGSVWIYGAHRVRKEMPQYVGPGESLIRVRVTEVPKKKRSKK